MLLTTLDELDAVLGTRFIILAGSAISGVDAPHLPMVNQFTCEVLRAAESIAPTDVYREALGGAYAGGLTGGRYSPLRAATKFEQFLEHLANTTSTKNVNALLAKVFTCGREEYGTSHAAIAELLSIDACAACLTTNFDNALERALEGSTPLHLFVTRQPNAADLASGHVLYKLHGDARTGTCDFRASDLAKKRREGFHKHLLDLLDGYTVLVVGYSGRGDIDIAPHLRGASARFVWGCLKPTDDLPWDDYNGDRLVLDLRSDRTLALAPNLLADLACRRGDRARVIRLAAPDHVWPDPLRQWVKIERVSVAALASEIFGWRVPMAALHLHYAGDDAASVFQLRSASLLNGAGAYGSVLVVCGRMLTSWQPTSIDRMSYWRYVGFAFWRLSLTSVARRVLHSVHITASRIAPGRLLADASRLYLEVCRDILQDIRHVKRRQARSASWQIEEAIASLQRSDSESPENDLLSRLVVEDVQELLGKPVPLEEFVRLFEEARDSGYQHATWAAATALARRDPMRGRRELGDLEKTLRRPGLRHYIWKSRLSRYESRIRQHTGPLERPLIACIRMVLLRGFVGGVCRATVKDLIVGLRRISWRLTKRLWRGKMPGIVQPWRVRRSAAAYHRCQ